jgi:hypothetical protein
MNARTLVSTAILSFGFTLQGQQPASTQKQDSASEATTSQQTASIPPPDSAQPREMEDWLNSGDEQEKINRLVSLGIDKATAKILTSDGIMDNILWKSLRTGSHQTYAILFFPCGSLGADLYLLSKQGKSWHILDETGLDCHYDNSVSVEIMPIRSPEIDEVLVHHVGMERGTGYSRQDLNVFSIANDKLKLDLDTEEVVVSMYTRPNGIDIDELQRSSFVVIPVSQSHTRILEETQSDLMNDKLSVLRRQFRWNAIKGRYLPTKFVPVVAAPDSIASFPPAAKQPMH